MMEQYSQVPMDMPATYRIYVMGDLDSSYAERYWGMESHPVEQTGELEQTMLIGEVIDQAALVGIINALYNGGHTVVSVERILPNTNLQPNDTGKET